MLSRLRLLTTLIAACLLTACQPAAPEITPEPSFQCTPEAGGEPYECSARQHEEMVAKDQLYAEAEAVYRRFLTEEARILHAGGLDKSNAELDAVATGSFLKNALDDYRLFSKEDVRAKGEGPTLVAFARSPGVSKHGSVVAANICVDYSNLRFVRNGKTLRRGPITSDETYFATQDGRLLIIGASGKEVDECD